MISKVLFKFKNGTLNLTLIFSKDWLYNVGFLKGQEDNARQNKFQSKKGARRMPDKDFFLQ